MRKPFQSILNAQQSGLILIIMALGVLLTLFSGTHTDPATGREATPLPECLQPAS